jgi:uncharacterized membrane protein YqjE
VGDERPEKGLFSSLRQMLATLVALLETRLELVSVEVEEQLQRGQSLLLWSIAALFLGSLAILMLAVTVIIAFWDSHRLLVAGLVTAFFAVAAVVATLVARQLLRTRPRFLESTIAELRRDSAALGGDRR